MSVIRLSLLISFRTKSFIQIQIYVHVYGTQIFHITLQRFYIVIYTHPLSSIYCIQLTSPNPQLYMYMYVLFTNSLTHSLSYIYCIQLTFPNLQGQYPHWQYCQPTLRKEEIEGNIYYTVFKLWYQSYRMNQWNYGMLLYPNYSIICQVHVHCIIVFTCTCVQLMVQLQYYCICIC